MAETRSLTRPSAAAALCSAARLRPPPAAAARFPLPRPARGGGAVAVAVAARAVSSPSVAFTSAAPPSATFGSRMAESVKRTVAENPVVIYSKSWCRYSTEVKLLFKRMGVEPLVIELDELGPQGPQLQKMLERLTGQYTVPNVFVGGKHIGGCTDTVKLHHKGELIDLLSEVNIDIKSFQKY